MKNHKILKHLAFIAPLLSSWFSMAYSVGDTVTISNAGGIVASDVITTNNQCSFAFAIQPDDMLPAGSVLNLKSVKFASVNESRVSDGSTNNDPHSIAFGTVRSQEVEHIATEKLAGRNIDLYAFAEDCHVVVGKEYVSGGGGIYSGLNGCGITFLHSNGNRWSGGSTMNCTVGYGDFAPAVLFDTARPAVSPLYSMEFEVVSVANVWRKGADSCLSNPSNWSLGRLPQNGDSVELYSASDVEAIVDVDLSLSSLTVRGGGTVTFTGESHALAVTNFTVATPVVVAGTSFQPQTVVFADGGTLAVDDGGLLTDAIVAYSGDFPVMSSVFSAGTCSTAASDAGKWRGTVWVRNVSNMTGSGSGNVFAPNSWGNASSTVRVSALKGWINSTADEATNTIHPAVELYDDGGEYALWLVNGNSYGGTPQYTKFAKLAGSGNLKCTDSAPEVLLWVLDASDFSGGITLANKCVAFGQTIPSAEGFSGARVYVMPGAQVKVGDAKTWAVANSSKENAGVHVYGELNARGMDGFSPDTRIYTYEDGVLVFERNGANPKDNAVSYGNISGNGTLRLRSTSNWRSLSKVGFPVGMTLECELGGGLLLQEPDHTYEIGSLAGTKGIRSDYDNGQRSLRVMQSADTVWSGVFVEDDRLETLYVGALSSEASGTLTLAGMQTHDNNLNVESNGLCRLTGRWCGSVEVCGTFGGNGEVQGAVAFNDGSRLALAEGDLSAPLRATTIAFSGNVTIDLPAGDAAHTVARSTDGIDISRARFTVVTGGKIRPGIAVTVSDGVLNVNLKRFYITIR